VTLCEESTQERNSTMLDKGSVDRKQSQVAKQRSNINENIEALIKAIDEIEARLADVLSMPVVDSNAQDVIASSLVPHAEFLSGISSKIYNAHQRIQSITSRIEL